MANSEVFKANGIASIGGGGFNGYVGYWYDNLLYRLMGNEKMNALYNGTDPSLAWTDPEPVMAAQMLVDMIHNGYAADGFVGGDFAANQVAFFTGQVAHLYVGTFVLGEVADVIPPDFEFGVTYFPTVEGYEDLTPYEAVTGFMNSFGIFNPGDDSTKNYSVECAVDYMKLYTDPTVQAGLVQALDFISPVKGVPGPDSIPGVGDVMAGIQEWWPANQAMYYTFPAELRTKMWDNIVLLTSDEVTPEEFGELMETDYAEYR
jgi:raffinose/stachyose/melibiose transport system substrate-binding protein